MSNYPAIILENYINIAHYDVEIDSHDPGKKDIGYLVYVAGLIPKSPTDIGKVDAGILATLCLAAHQEASRFYAEALMWWRVKEVKMNSELGIAIAGITPATNADKKAKSDENFKKAALLSVKGEAITRFYESLKNNFETGHYWAKEKEKSDNSERKMSSYDPHAIKTGGESPVIRNDKFQEEKVGEFDFQG